MENEIEPLSVSLQQNSKGWHLRGTNTFPMADLEEFAFRKEEKVEVGPEDSALMSTKF